MVALFVLLIGAASTIAGAVAGWCPLGRGLFVGGLLVIAAGLDLLPDGADDDA